MGITMTEMQKSALLEAGNIGSGHAANALSQLMNRKIMIAVPSVEMVEFSRLNRILADKERNFVQVNLLVLGDIKGLMVFALEEEVAVVLCDIVMGQQKGVTKLLGDLEQSALKEVGSIISASYLNAVSELTGLSVIISTPDCNIGRIEMLNKILIKREIEIKSTKEVICIKTELTETTTKIEGYLVFFPADGAINKMMGALGV